MTTPITRHTPLTAQEKTLRIKEIKKRIRFIKTCRAEIQEQALKRLSMSFKRRMDENGFVCYVLANETSIAPMPM